MYLFFIEKIYFLNTFFMAAICWKSGGNVVTPVYFFISGEGVLFKL